MKRYVGKSVRRRDANAKASGVLQYLNDLPCEGLYGCVVRATVASGRIRRIAFDPAFEWHDIVIVDFRDIPGTNINRMLQDDQPFLTEKEVRFVGEPVLLLAHADKDHLQKAKRHITIDYDLHTPVLTLDDALEAKNIIYGSDNVFETLRIKKGDVREGFASQHCRTIEGIYETGHQEQLYMEPQSMAAYWRDGDIKIVGSMQCPGYVEGALEILTGRKVEVEQTPTGGGFGGKEDYPSLMGAYVWLLCNKAQRDVKLIYDRSEDIAVTTKRHPARMHYKTAVDETGTIQAMEVEVLIDGGAYVTLSPVVLSRAVIHSTGLYDIPNVSITGRAMATNTPPNGAFRGFGAPQVFFGIERHMDDIAALLGIAPQTLRERNLPGSNSTLVTGGPLPEAESFRRLFYETMRRSDFAARREALEASNRHSRTKRGIGMALFMHGGGFTGNGETMLDSRVQLALQHDGSVEIRVYSVEMGQGAATVLTQRVADALELPLASVRYAVPNTRRNADSGPTVASRTTMVVGDLLEEAAGKLKSALTESCGRYSDAESFKKAAARYCGTRQHCDFMSRFRKPDAIAWDEEQYRGQPYLNYSLGCYVAEITVDPVDYRARVTRFHACSDIGRPVNLKLAAGQVQGGVIQALGYALQERIVHDNGAPENPRLSDYMIPVAADIPDIHVAFIRDADARPKGLGELPMDGPAAAIANAVTHALGKAFNTLPVTAETIMEALHED